ncbi:hypothetical protein HUJ05_007595 [Dendroctonus ponderosae]|nr:hypothetical protein HUJ05_007595 [Dendroctonus ponderosae]
MAKTNDALRVVGAWLAANQLEVAAEKTEAVILSGKRDRREVSFRMGQQVIRPAGTELASLARLLPNIGGPRMAKRALLYGVMQSILLYGAPIWHEVVRMEKYRGMLESMQKRALLRTVSSEASQVIAGIPPIDLLTRERVVLDETGERPVTAETRRATRCQILQEVLIADVRKWVECAHKSSGYFLTQALSGYGCFKDYLLKIGRVGDGECWYCGEQDSPQHTLFVCPRMLQDTMDSPAS